VERGRGDERRSGETGHVRFDMARQTMGIHIGAYPLGNHSQAHYHGPGAHLLILKGKGYDLLWPLGETKEKMRIDLQPGSLFVPPDRWFHQHFNTGPEPRRHVAIKTFGSRRKSVMNQVGYKSTIFGLGSGTLSIKKGGTQIDFEDEEPKIHEEFEAELGKAGITCRMGEVHPFCTRRQKA